MGSVISTSETARARRHRRRAWRVCIVAAISLGCRSAYTTWQPVPEATLRQSEDRKFTKLLVVTQDGHELELAPATLAGDSLIGTSTGGGQAGIAKGQRVALLRSQVSRLESRELSTEPARNAVGATLLEVGKGVAEGLGCALTLFRVCK